MEKEGSQLHVKTKETSENAERKRKLDFYHQTGIE